MKIVGLILSILFFPWLIAALLIQHAFSKLAKKQSVLETIIEDAKYMTMDMLDNMGIDEILEYLEEIKEIK